MSPAKQKTFQAAADKAIAWSTAEHLKREAELADSFRKMGLEIYTPDVKAFRDYAQKIYLSSDEAEGLAERDARENQRPEVMRALGACCTAGRRTSPQACSR